MSSFINYISSNYKTLRLNQYKKNNSYKFFFILLLVLSLNTATALNSITITASTLSALPSCLNYQIRGVCYWLSYGHITTTSYVEQYLPDLVVSIFNKPGDDPWLEVNNTIDYAGQVAEKTIVPSLTGFQVGNGQHGFSSTHEQNVFFKEADVIGNPALAVLANNLLFLPSAAVPMMPYYQSMLDAAVWRGLPQVKTTLAEEDYALAANVIHHIGTLPINWGGIYPHEGKIATSNDAKAAAVIAQRAADITTSLNPLVMTHIHQPLPNQCGEECTAEPIQENSSNTKFQLIYPVQQTYCDYFGKTATYGNDIETQTQGAYVWIVWRFYSGCIQGDGEFIGKTITN